MPVYRGLTGAGIVENIMGTGCGKSELDVAQGQRRVKRPVILMYEMPVTCKPDRQECECVDHQEAESKKPDRTGLPGR